MHLAELRVGVVTDAWKLRAKRHRSTEDGCINGAVGWTYNCYTLRLLLQCITICIEKASLARFRIEQLHQTIQTTFPQHHLVALQGTTSPRQCHMIHYLTPVTV